MLPINVRNSKHALDLRLLTLTCRLIAALVGVFAQLACVALVDAPEVWRCKSGVDCKGNEKCYLGADPNRGTCKPVTYCEQSGDCPENGVCTNQVCGEPECRYSAFSSTACAPYSCAVNNRCEQNCAATGLCATGYLCVQGICLQPQCNPLGAAESIGDSGPCGAYLCNGDHRCLTHCDYSAHCTPDFACENRQCVPRQCLPGSLTSDCGAYPCADGICSTDCRKLGCASGYQCESGSCVPNPEMSCTTDAMCASNCCPTETPNFNTCTSACEYKSMGEACTWGGMCLSGVCEDEKCAACSGEECRGICGDRQCGNIGGLSCGACEGTSICNGQSQCLDLCAGRECGESAAGSCGTCTTGSYCSPEGTCLPDPCANRQCGASGGINCGECLNSLPCHNGQCRAPTCPSGRERYCKGDNVYSCNLGFDEQLLETCAAGSKCVSGYSDSSIISYGEASCRPPCAPGKVTCTAQGEFGVCGPGYGLASPGRNCTQESLDCTPYGCGKNLLSTFGKSSATATELCSEVSLVGNVFEVRTAVILNVISMHLVAPAGTQYDWVVYASNSATGPFSSVVNVHGIGNSETVSVQSSPPMGVSLTPTLYYLIGAAASSAGVRLCSDPTPQPQAAAFGQHLGTSVVLLLGEPYTSMQAVSGTARMTLTTVDVK